jgi:MscS family membrane protein
MIGGFGDILAMDSWQSFVNYELVRGNSVWRFAMVLAGVLAVMIVGRIAQYAINNFASKLERKKAETGFTSTLKALSKPVYVGVVAIGINFCQIFLYFNAETGINPSIANYWSKIAEIVGSIAIIYALYQLVDVIELYLERMVSKTETKLDDMLVPVVRKSIRITITIVGALFVAQNVTSPEKVRTLFLGAGIGGIAIAMAAKDTIANFFGSITIFADRPFQVEELIKVNGHLGIVEEVGFRSTRIRTLEGTLVTIPNNTIANVDIENVSSRPFIRRTSNITITYDSGCDKTQKAVDIIKKVLTDVPEVNMIANKPPRVYFSDFNDCSLNIYMSYWVQPADYWGYQEVNERVNFAIMKQFEAEDIDFAFPTRTLYMKNADKT